jgi:hypothetical protein
MFASVLAPRVVNYPAGCGCFKAGVLPEKFRMKVYTLAPLEGAEWVTLHDSDPDQWEIFFALQGPVGGGWRTPRMSAIREFEDGTARQYSDCPWCLHNILIVRDRVLPALMPILQGYGEILPLRCDEPVSLFNATTIVDGLDEERSTVARFDSGEVLAIERHVFKPNAIGSVEIFKLPGRASNIYLRESVVRRIGALGLRGLAFDMVWADEAVASSDLRVEYGSA